MDFYGLALGEITGTAAFILIAVAVITRKLVWHTDLDKEVARCERTKQEETARADKWEKLALDMLGVAEKLTKTAEATNEVLQQIPKVLDPNDPQDSL